MLETWSFFYVKKKQVLECSNSTHQMNICECNWIAIEYKAHLEISVEWQQKFFTLKVNAEVDNLKQNIQTRDYL